MISMFTVYQKLVNSFCDATSTDADKATGMRKIIWIYTGRKCSMVVFFEQR